MKSSRKLDLIFRIVLTGFILRKTEFLGCLGGNWLRPQQTTTEVSSTGGGIDDTTTPGGTTGNVDLSKLVCVEDYEAPGYRSMGENSAVFVRDGADNNITLKDNGLAYKRLTMRPRFLVDVSHRTISTTILGKPVSMPVGVPPCGFMDFVTPEGGGDIIIAKIYITSTNGLWISVENSYLDLRKSQTQAAEKMGIIYIQPALSNAKMEDLAAETPNLRKWLQVYILKSRAVTVNLVRRAEESGFEAIVVLVDVPANGKRRDIKRHFKFPTNMTLGNFGEEMGDLVPQPFNFLQALALLQDDSLTFKDIAWLKSITRLPLFVKGIYNAEDAQMAVLHGADGIIVSNHGGRQLDTAGATIDMLPEIVDRVGNICTVMVDGGIRTGTDVFKALALGAKMVFAGRPIYWGIAVDRQNGVANILSFYRDELNTTMALAGVQNIDQINKNYVGKSVNPQPM